MPDEIGFGVAVARGRFAIRLRYQTRAHNKQEQLYGEDRASRDKSAWNIHVIAQFSMQIHFKKMSELENKGQSNRSQHPQWCHSMTNIHSYIYVKDFTHLHIFPPLFFMFFRDRP